MASILAAVETALTRIKPTHKVPFHQLVPYLLDPTPEYVVRIETLAGICKAVITSLTPDHTVRHLQCAYRAHQFVAYLGNANIVIPSDLCQLVAKELYTSGYTPSGDIWDNLTDRINIVDVIADVIECAPTEFSDTFAVQLCVPDGSYKHILPSVTPLSELGLASRAPLTLVVTIRPDRAEFDAARQSMADPVILHKLAHRVHARSYILGMKYSLWTIEQSVRCKLLDDWILMYETVRCDGQFLMNASDKLKANREIVLVAVQNSGCALQYASDELKVDYEVVLAAVQQYGCALEYASDELRANREIVLAAVQQRGCALEYASDELKVDYEVVLAAVKQTGWALQFTSSELQADNEVVMTTVQTSGHALIFASDELKADRDIVMTAVQQKGYALEFASDELKADREIVLAAVRHDGYVLQYASDELKADHEIVLAAVQQDGGALQYASDELRSDHEIVAVATQCDKRAIQFARVGL